LLIDIQDQHQHTHNSQTSIINVNDFKNGPVPFFLQHMFCARIDPAIDDKHGGKDVVITEVRWALDVSVVRCR